MSVKFIHAADLHIDSAMHGLTAMNERMGRQVSSATREAFQELVNYAVKPENEISFVIISGDVYDGGWDSAETGLWTNRQFLRLKEVNIPVWIVFGNHDKKNRIIQDMGGEIFSDNVHVFDDKEPERCFFEKGSQRFAITGQSYSDWRCVDDLASKYPSPEKGAFNIGVLHTDLGGEKSGSYAPTTVENLRAKGYDYWALGHQHKREVLRDDASCFIGYSGVLQARHVNECVNADGSTSKGFFVVEVDDGRRVGAPEFVAVDKYRWSQISIDLSEIDDSDVRSGEKQIVDRVREEIHQKLKEAGKSNVIVRIQFTGRTALYGQLTNPFNDDEDSATLKRLRNKIESVIDERISIEKFDVSLLKPSVPENFWEKGAFREIHDKLLNETSVDSQSNAKDGSLLSNKDFALLFKKIGARTDLLLYGTNNPDYDDAPDPDGIDIHSAEQIRRWREEALDILADAFMTSEEEAGKK